MRFEVITILARLTPIEDRAFELEPAIRETGRENSEADVRRVLQVMRKRRRRILRCGSAMHECIWSKRGLARIPDIRKPARAVANRHGVSRTQLHEEIVRMLPIDQWLAFVSLACLKE